MYYSHKSVHQYDHARCARAAAARGVAGRRDINKEIAEKIGPLERVAGGYRDVGTMGFFLVILRVDRDWWAEPAGRPALQFTRRWPRVWLFTQRDPDAAHAAFMIGQNSRGRSRNARRAHLEVNIKAALEIEVSCATSNIKNAF